MTAGPAVMRGTLRWRVLVWVCSEPGEWSIRSLAADMEESYARVKPAVYSLRARGLLAYGLRLSPTPTGRRALASVPEPVKQEG
jgi:hypothetical protein